jgi:hypothetical protein
MKKNNELNKIIKECKNSKTFRQALAYQSHEWFFRLYLNHYMEYPFSWFHKQMFGLSEHPEINLVVISAFRGAGKSTILNLSMALWSILGKPQKKFVLIISQSIFQAKTQIKNIIEELRENELLINDFDLINERKLTKNLTMIEFEKLEAKIIIAITEQSLRGLRYKSKRPDLIICDDLENKFVTYSRGKNNTKYEWFKEDVLSCGDFNTKIIVLGTPISTSSILFNLMKDILEERIKGVFKLYPLFDSNDKVLWSEKFKNEDIVSDTIKNIPKDTYLQEYLLKTKDGRVGFSNRKIESINKDIHNYESSKELPGSSAIYYLSDIVREAEKRNKECEESKILEEKKADELRKLNQEKNIYEKNKPIDALEEIKRILREK